MNHAQGSADAFVRIDVEVVVRVTDAEKIRQRARAEIARLRADNSDIPESEWGPIEEDLANAVLAVIEPDGLLVEGLEPGSATVGVRLCDSGGQPREQPPAFGEIFEVCECGRPDCLDCGGWQLTPRMAVRLWVAAQVLADRAFDDILAHGDDPVGGESVQWSVFDDYPRITWTQNAVWRRQAARAFDDLAGDLAAGQWPQPTCPAEEMALRLVLAAAAASLTNGAEPQDLIAPLQQHGEDDTDFDMAFEVLFQDDDIGALLDPAQDGIEDASGEVNQALGIGDYRAEAWFEPFLNVTPRDPRRPFRR